MTYVLVATSRGDELQIPRTTVVATSQSRKALEKLRQERARERAEWLATNKLPPGAEASVTAFEEIHEVKEVWQ